MLKNAGHDYHAKQANCHPDTTSNGRKFGAILPGSRARFGEINDCLKYLSTVLVEKGVIYYTPG